MDIRGKVDRIGALVEVDRFGYGYRRFNDPRRAVCDVDRNRKGSRLFDRLPRHGCRRNDVDRKHEVFDRLLRREGKRIPVDAYPRIRRDRILIIVVNAVGRRGREFIRAALPLKQINEDRAVFKHRRGNFRSLDGDGKLNAHAAAGKRDRCAARPLRRERKRSVRDRCRHLLRIVAFCLYFIAVGRDIIGNIDRIRFPHDSSDLLAVLHSYGRFALCNGCDHEIGIDCDLISGLFAFTADQPCHEFKILIFRNARLRQRELRPAPDLRIHAVNAHRVCTIYRYLKCYGNICTRECNRRFAFCLRRYGERILRHGSRCYGIVR